LPAEEELAPGVRLRRLDIDRRISAGFNPLPGPVRATLSRAIGLDPAAIVLSPDRPLGLDRLRHPLRRLLEITANARRVGPWTEAVLAAAPDTDVFHAQSLIALPVVRRAAQRLRGRFVYDVADYHTEAARLARMPRLIRAIVRHREAGWARDASGFLAVSDPVADLVRDHWNVPRPAVLLNCPPAWRADQPDPPVSRRIGEALRLAPERPVVLYQGGFSVDRGVEELAAAAESDDLRGLDAAVVFMGYGRLQGFVEEAARRHPDRIYVLPAVPPDELLDWTASADVSFVGQPPRTLNQRMNLPNKLFESIMAGVPVVVSEGNEQCRLVSAEKIGSCTDVDSPEAVAASIAALLRQPAWERQRLRAHCRTVALSRYTWDLNATGLVALYRRLADERGPREAGTG
jgi:glycosyltransferase involved in cell wall biosynthesis